MDASPPTRRQFYPAPAWLVYGALVATGVLAAAERWRWFPANYQKGWPVVLAVAVVGTAFLATLAWMLTAAIFRRRVQFGLRTLLVFVTLCAVVCSWFTVRLREARRQAEAVAAIQDRLRGVVWYDREFNDPSARPPGPALVRKLLGPDFFADVQWIRLESPQVTDAGLADLEPLKELKGLWIDAEITDTGLKHLEGLTNLRDLFLFGKVTYEGIKKLRRALPGCKIEALQGTLLIGKPDGLPDRATWHHVNP
jgi:hypothetical protein